MWVICFDISNGFKLFQQCVPCEMVDKNTVLIKYYNEERKLDIENIREIEKPKYDYGDKVSPLNHKDMIGEIIGISWHFKYKKHIYKISINGKVKSKRYFDENLVQIIK